MAPPWGALGAIDLNTGNFCGRSHSGNMPGASHLKGMGNTGSDDSRSPGGHHGGCSSLLSGPRSSIRNFTLMTAGRESCCGRRRYSFSGLATPATYMVNGKQYVVITARAGPDQQEALGGVYIAFALP